MRHLTKVLLTAGLAVAFVSLVLAQGRGGGGFGQITETTLLGNKEVQSELKLTDAQKEKVTKISEKMRADMKDAFKDGKEAITKVREEADKATTEFVKAELKPEQAKRLKQLYLQLSVQLSPVVFTKEEVQKELKLTDKQTEMIKNTVGDVQKDAKEIRDGVPKKDKDKAKEATEKITKLNKEAIDKITGTFTAEQKSTWKEMVGAPTEIKAESLLQFGGGFGKKKKTDN